MLIRSLDLTKTKIGNEKRASFFILPASIVFQTSCKAYKNPNSLNPKYIIETPELAVEILGLQNILEGDEIKVVRKGMNMAYLVFARAVGGYLSGEVWKDGGKKLNQPKAIRIPINQIEYIKVRRKSVGATLG